jgi:TatD DNase family protein
MRLYDAHNHLQDDRFGGQQAGLLAACAAAGVERMVVNGSCESDWPEVLKLARSQPRVLASFGYHPWYVAERTPAWRERLVEHLDAIPSAVGEIGLDRWKPGLAYDGQEEVFTTQLRLAAARNLPVSIHCLQAWGRLCDLLRAGPLPRCGFLLHSYGGPAELVAPLAELGGYFGFPGYFLLARKERQRHAFLRVPPDRLLIETDAPDQPLPSVADAAPEVRGALAGAGAFPLKSVADGKVLNHPANLAAVYHGLAALLREPVERLAERVGANFQRLFGGIGGAGQSAPPPAR